MTDVGRPEPILFLMEAADAMSAYHAKHQRYPEAWHLLDIAFASGPYRVTDPGVHPKPGDGKRWRPPRCEYTYEIAAADAKTFLIHALNKHNAPEYELRQGMTQPRSLRGEEPCQLEAPRGKKLPEPARFLNAAAEAFRQHHSKHGSYPDQWSQLDFHWALIDHKASDAQVRPPAGRSWHPLGGSYRYEIVQTGPHHYLLRSRGDGQQPDYQISSTVSYPVLTPR